MSDIRITAGPYTFGATWERERAPRTVAAFEELLPFRQRVIHVRWSGESAWIPLGEMRVGVDHRKAHARVIRGGVPVFDGRMSTLRRFKDEVEEVRTNFECGIRLGEFNEYEEGDIIECYKLEKYAQTL